MMTPIVEQMRDAEMGFCCFDAYTQQFVRQRGDIVARSRCALQVFVQVSWHALLGDNPMLEKLCMITGKGCCRLCSVRRGF